VRPAPAVVNVTRCSVCGDWPAICHGVIVCRRCDKIEAGVELEDLNRFGVDLANAQAVRVDRVAARQIRISTTERKGGRMLDQAAGDNPAVSYITDDGRPYWLLDEAFRIWIEPGKSLTVAAGFRFDLASIPRPLWPIVAPFELSIAAPLLHDYLYRWKGDPGGAALLPPTRVGRRTVDQWFRVVMRAEQVGRFRRWAAWLAVRVFGWFAWRKGRPYGGQS